MKINNYGDVFLKENEIFEAVYSGKLKTVEYVYSDKSIVDKFNQSKNKNADSFAELKYLVDRSDNIESFDKKNQDNWFLPLKQNIDLIDFLYSNCTVKEQKDRVTQELELFNQHNMINLLYYLKYLVDTMRENNIVWGVGRGSSIASYVLYLIGVHKIDSLKYNLDIKEFIK